MQILKSDPICWELSRTLEINHFIFEVGSRKSEVGSRKSEVGSRKSEVGSPSSAFVTKSSSLPAGSRFLGSSAMLYIESESFLGSN